MSASDEIIQQYQERSEYDHGFVTDVETIEVPKGLSEETIKFISAQKKTTMDVGLETECLRKTKKYEGARLAKTKISKN